MSDSGCLSGVPCVGFVLKGQRAQPERESRSAGENEPAAQKGNHARVAKMVRKNEPTNQRTPLLGDSVRDHEPTGESTSVREPTEKKIARENEPATTRRAGEDEPPRVSNFGTLPASHLTTAQWAAPRF